MIVRYDLCRERVIPLDKHPDGSFNAIRIPTEIGGPYIHGPGPEHVGGLVFARPAIAMAGAVCLRTHMISGHIVWEEIDRYNRTYVRYIHTL